MATREQSHRMAWLVIGVLVGLCLSSFWPHAPVTAATSDRMENKFGLITVPVREVTVAGFQDKQEGVFVLDYVTGRLQGAVLNSRLGRFTHFYYRNLAADFEVDPTAEPAYAMVTGTAQLPAKGRITWANGVVYVAELTSGRVHAYAFPYTDSRAKLPRVSMHLIDAFPFRQPLEAD